MAGNGHIVLGVGNPLLDISADVEQATLDKYEVKLNNAILCEEKQQPMYDDLVKNFNVQYIAGGATQNSIRVCQWMLQKPGATAYIGSVGKDDFAKQLGDCAKADNVTTYYYEDPDTPTGTCACLIMDKERSLIANLAAANNYKIEHMQSPEIEAVYKQAEIIYSAGFFLTVSPPTLMLLANHAEQANKTFVMNLSAPFICQFFSEPLLAAMPFVDIIFGNEAEAEALGATMKLEDKSPAAVAEALAALPKNGKKARIAVVTQGANPTIVCIDGKTTQYPVPPLAADQIVDVNGAGDAFVGGFLSQFSQGKDIEVCVAAGNYAASVVLGVSGTVLSGAPTFGQ
mmetsp:Transcript_1787/g.1963  ORF Transcript_1787/g.1963 Transcript_1787/m.1963 type:complete len:343 (+) Transcript_1787:27-1055(+)|eukprot:CAMPEP_0205821962 /NCGR_PEP_ID=MMETSP0206-20130828/10417_1 /ASSEMBLY_ACC=CAM_ASM_000279 /TAXON_ID=36767 /ORGANISM="Euplotes focardii, Strain TN1" /LENGTH=342 /DNA_ID=CAMNT_0053117859 /DNA_START=32 /DNA_END=1060 /DNA_ORIENTATION=+